MTGGTIDETLALRVVQALGTDDFFVYSDGVEARVALGTSERIMVRRESVDDPWAGLGDRFEGLAGSVAYGYLAFDLARHDHAYPHSIDVPLHFIVPKIHCIFREGGYEVWPPEARSVIEGALARPLERQSSPLELDPSSGQAEYRPRLEGALAEIRAGHLDKVIVTRTVTARASLDVIGTYERALVNQCARRFCFRLGDIKGVGTSPEVVIVARNGGFYTTPLAGTKPRGKTPEEDERLRAELMAEAKEVREHAISVLLAQEEVLRVCAPESFGIREFMKIKLYPFTQHLSSRVGGRLAEGKTVWDAARAVFPGVTCSGIPKAAAVPLLGKLEGAPRGVYGGAVGFWERGGGGGSLDLGIALRSAFEYDGVVSISAGAGMVADSSVEAELDESVNKMKTIAKHLVGTRSTVD
jgi:salicylate synthetase